MRGLNNLMADVLKLQGTEITVNSATGNTVSSASFVRVVCNLANTVLTLHSASANTNASCTVLSGDVVLLAKAPADTLFASVNCLAAPVKFW